VKLFRKVKTLNRSTLQCLLQLSKLVLIQKMVQNSVTTASKNGEEARGWRSRFSHPFARRLARFEPPVPCHASLPLAAIVPNYFGLFSYVVANIRLQRPNRANKWALPTARVDT
jgi:hypothetical protein